MHFLKNVKPLVQMIKYAVQELQTEQLFDCLYYQIYVLL